MKREQLAIIGNGMATSRLLDELLRRHALNHFDITVFGDEASPCYNRILLNRVLLGGEIDEITLKTREWFAEHRIRLISGKEVTRLSAGSQRLWTNDGQEYYFDRAIFATGSLPRIPLLEGMKRSTGELKHGVTAYRTVADCELMRKTARPGRPAVVIGGGLLGLEAAKGLADLGMNVTVLHLFDTLMNRQLDHWGSTMLRQAVEKLGIAVRTSVGTKAIVGNTKVEAVQLKSGELLPADLVIFASGVKPRINLASDSDVPTNAGILVDDQLRTQLPNLYAVGECAEHRGQTYGTVQPVYEQCVVLADVLCGSKPDAAYQGTKVYTRLKVVGLEVASMGEVEAKEQTDEVIQIIEEQKQTYRKLVIRQNRLLGAVLVGDTSCAASLTQRFSRGDLLPPNRLDLFASSFRSNDQPEGPVCQCHQVHAAQIQQAITAGCRTLVELGSRTGAGTGCGSCRGRLSSMLMKSKTADAICPIGTN
ncbi:FAD-dependent oxidoreductase [Zavarzinella formosa]|uniref:FAD-dependent oxidoreductase n=1 Tax=Zavarzinella formosa TaxID=360055 RepID=UPI0003074AA7|nr:FAD-dependent oxidoreductase [Zavarzinella formosa]